MRKLNRQLGISLVEVLVALVISLFLLAGIVQVYSGNKATFSFTNALAEIQENGRFSMDLVSNDLRGAGGWGCVTFDPLDTSNINNTLSGATVAGYSAAAHDFINQQAIEGTNNTGLNGSDTLIMRGSAPGGVNIENPFYVKGVPQLRVDDANSISVNDIILVARCGANDTPIEADILAVTATADVTNGTAEQTNLTVSSIKSQMYLNDASVLQLQTVTYSIQPGASGEPALFRQEFNRPADEMVEGVEDMQVLYGIDTNGDRFANQYFPAAAGLNYANAVSIRIMLLVRSFRDFVADTPQTYSFNGVQTTAGDRRLRQVFTATIALRNRIGSI